MPTIEAMTIAGIGTTVDRVPMVGDELGRTHNRVAVALDLAGRLDVTLPDEIRANYDHAVTLRRTPVSPTLAELHRQAADDLAAGRITITEMEARVAQAEADARTDDESRRARTKVLRAAAGKAYMTAVHHLRHAAADIVEQLRGQLAETIAAQSGRFERPELRERYDQIHDLAESLRFETGSVRDAHQDWYRFADAPAVWCWRLNQVRAHGNGTARSQGVHGGVHWLTVHGPAPDLVAIAAHADQWRPTIQTGDQVLAAINAYEQTLLAS